MFCRALQLNVLGQCLRNDLAIKRVTMVGRHFKQLKSMIRTKGQDTHVHVVECLLCKLG